MTNGQLAARHEGTLGCPPFDCPQGGRSEEPLPPYGCALPMVLPSGSTTKVHSICLAKKSGLSASIARRGYVNVISQTFPLTQPRSSLPGAIKGHWVCEQAHQQLKEELGLDHFKGRFWKGLHRHCLMAMIALAFLQSRRLKQAKGKKRIAGPPPQPTLPAVRQAILTALAQPPPVQCPHCNKTINANLPK